jgi:hypothetical protein
MPKSKLSAKQKEIRRKRGHPTSRRRPLTTRASARYAKSIERATKERGAAAQSTFLQEKLKLLRRLKSK